MKKYFILYNHSGGRKWLLDRNKNWVHTATIANAYRFRSTREAGNWAKANKARRWEIERVKS